MSKLWVITFYSLLFLTSDFFLNQSRTVLVQFVFNTSLFVILIMFIRSIQVNEMKYKFLKNLVSAFWFGQVVIYVIGLRNAGEGYEYWFNHVYEYIVLIPVYLASLASAIIYTFVWKR